VLVVLPEMVEHLPTALQVVLLSLALLLQLAVVAVVVVLPRVVLMVPPVVVEVSPIVELELSAVDRERLIRATLVALVKD
jgi:hypothetical protein